MKWVKRILLGLLALIAILVVIGFFLPSSYHVERSVTIKGKPANVFPFVNGLKAWNYWSAWSPMQDPKKYGDMKQEYSTPDSGKGATMSWSGKEAGNGKFTITDSDPEKGISYDLDFEKGQYLSNGVIRFEPAGDSVKVTWTNEGKLGMNPIGRYFGLLMDRFMGPDFETGLANLKKRVETP